MEKEIRGLLSENDSTIKCVSKRGIQIMPAPHVHTGYELYFCPESITQRTVICVIEYEYTHPAAILSKPYSIHSMSCLEDCKSDYRRYVFYFDERVASELGIELFPDSILEESMGILFRLDEEESLFIENLISFCFGESFPLNDREKSLILSLVLSKLYTLTRDGRMTGVGTKTYYVQNVLKYISEHFSDDIDTATLAEHFSVSRSKLDRDFKTAIGSTPKTFIESCRLSNAKHYLVKASDMKIFEIAERCGFASDQYFYRFFKRHTGLTPAEYRKNNAKKMK